MKVALAIVLFATLFAGCHIGDFFKQCEELAAICCRDESCRPKDESFDKCYDLKAAACPADCSC